jgi:hypothetical protein
MGLIVVKFAYGAGELVLRIALAEVETWELEVAVTKG